MRLLRPARRRQGGCTAGVGGLPGDDEAAPHESRIHQKKSKKITYFSIIQNICRVPVDGKVGKM